MKQIIMVGAMLFYSVAALAATKCVNTIAPDDYGTVVNSGRSDWQVSFSNGLVLQGVAMCGPRGDAVYIGDMADSIERWGGAEPCGGEWSACWCKMTSPRVSRWMVFDVQETSPCTSNCPFVCGNRLRWPEIANAMLRGVGPSEDEKFELQCTSTLD